MNTKTNPSRLCVIAAGAWLIALTAPHPSLASDDPLFAHQWGLPRIGAPAAWTTASSSTGVIVAVMSTGINYNHEDLAANMWRNPGEIGLDDQGRDKATNGVDDDANGYVDDVYGIDTAPDANDSDPMDQGQSGFFLGTAVAGVIGAVANNTRGIAGVAPSVQLMALRTIGANGSGTSTGRQAAQDYIIMMKNRGVNIRAVAQITFATAATDAARIAMQAVADAGILPLAPAGDSTRNVDVTPVFPACLDVSTLISVAASDQSDALPGFASYGATNVDLAAPGAGIFTTSGVSPDSYYQPAPNASAYACAHVGGCGCFALCRAARCDTGRSERGIVENRGRIPSVHRQDGLEWTVECRPRLGLPEPASATLHAKQRGRIGS